MLREVFILFLVLMEKSSSEVFNSFEDTANTFRLEREIVAVLKKLTPLQTEEKNLPLKR